MSARWISSVWSALNPARGAVLPEEAAQAGMILLGYLALALRLDKAVPSALRAAIADNDQQALGKLLARLDEQAGQLGLGELFPAKIAITWSPASRSFLGKVLDLALEHGVSETFEALIAAVWPWFPRQGRAHHAIQRRGPDHVAGCSGPRRGDRSCLRVWHAPPGGEQGGYCTNSR